MIKVEHSILGMCGTNTYYVYNDETKKALIIDPADEAEHIIGRVEKLGLTPVGILLTHGHYDHILALDEVRDHFNIKAYIGATEKEVLHDPEQNLTVFVYGRGMKKDADYYLKDGEEFTIEDFKIKAIEVPGHTIGGMSYYFPDSGLLFSGDVLFYESVGRTDFKGGNMSALIGGIQEKLFKLPDDTMVYPGHMESTTIGHEKKNNFYVR